MKYAVSFLLCQILLLAGDWQATAAAGFGQYHPLAFHTPAGAAEAGIGPRYALSATVGRQFAGHFALELGWTLQDGDFELSSGSRKTAFDANAHSLHGDLLVYLRRPAAKLRPYVMAAAGVKIYRGLEAPLPRPLGEFGSFRDGNDARALAAFGGGLEYTLAPHWALRLDLRDNATPFPSAVIVPAAGANLGGWLHDFVASAGVTFRLHRGG